MSKIHLIGGEKGGVGKSVLARVLSQYFIDRNMAYAGVDADTSHGALVRYYGDFTQAIDLRRLDSADQIMDRALAAERRVLVDLPAQSLKALVQWMEDGDVIAFARDSGIQIVLWHVTDGGFDSIELLSTALKHFSDQIRYVVVKNGGRASDFSQYEESWGSARVGELGGRAIDLPELHASTMYRIDKSGQSFWAAIHATGPDTLSPMDKQRTKIWLARCYGALDRMGDEI
ncbi:MAG TPA: hypothetical protein VJT73_02545 [Polyangiaceae bacterium]|nr:hypothetical protein [Polyangiaceae bacterium]